MLYVTQLTPSTSLTMRRDTFIKKLMSKWYASAVIKSVVTTARRIIIYPSSRLSPYPASVLRPRTGRQRVHTMTPTALFVSRAAYAWLMLL